jgi:hypothetical protein
VLHVSTFPKSSSGESQEYQTKFVNRVTSIWIRNLQFGFVFFDNECSFVKCSLTMHKKTVLIYGFYLSLRLFKTNIHYNFVFNINNYIDGVCP